MAAAIWRPRPIAARGEHRGGRHGVDDLGHEHHGGDLAGVAPGLGALGHDDVHAGGAVALGVRGGAGQGGHDHPGVMGPGDERGRRAARGRSPPDAMSWAKATSSRGS